MQLRNNIAFKYEATSAYSGVLLSSYCQSSDCTALANNGNCDFYTNCIEARCGTNGYCDIL